MCALLRALTRCKTSLMEVLMGYNGLLVGLQTGASSRSMGLNSMGLNKWP